VDGEIPHSLAFRVFAHGKQLIAVFVEPGIAANGLVLCGMLAHYFLRRKRVHFLLYLLVHPSAVFGLAGT
jgi:hypothetical protein